MRNPLAVAFLVLTACQQQRGAEPLPSISQPDFATATIAGRIHDGNDLPVQGVVVTVAETDATYTTGADGQYVLRVPAQSTFTVRTWKYLYGGTTLTPLQLEPERTVTGLDILVIPSSSIGAYNAQAGSDEERGLLAIQVISLSGRCAPADAKVTVLNPETLQPVPGALALYVKPGTSQPDRAVTAMQNGSRPNAWLVGVPEGQNFPVRFDKAGCAAVSFPVVYQNMTYQPGLRIAARGLTQVPIFVE